MLEGRRQVRWMARINEKCNQEDLRKSVKKNIFNLDINNKISNETSFFSA